MPFDLGNSIGYPIIAEMHEELVKAIEKIHKAVVDNGKRIGMWDLRSLVKILRISSGIYCTSGEQARMYADKGFHMVSLNAIGMSSVVADLVDQISVISDMQALPSILTSSLKTANGSYTHAALNVAKSGVSKLAGPYFGGPDS